MSATPFDMLVSAALIVRDPHATVDELHARLGLPLPRPAWLQDWPGWGYRAWWCRVHPSLRAAPTRLEINGPRPIGRRDRASGNTSFLAEMESEQRARPLRFHASVVGVHDLGGFAARLREGGGEHYVDPPSGAFAYPRTWVGRTVRQDRARYATGVDGGLRLEVLPLDEIGLPASALASRSPETYAPGEIVRITRRQILVPSVPASLAALERSLGWTADVLDLPGGRWATLGFVNARSAVVELLEPARGTSDWNTLQRFGGGAHRITMAVAGLDAKARDLESRRTRFEMIGQSDAGGPRLRVTEPGISSAFEFEELEAA